MIQKTTAMYHILTHMLFGASTLSCSRCDNSAGGLFRFRGSLAFSEAHARAAAVLVDELDAS